MKPVKIPFLSFEKYLFPGLSEFESLSALGLLPLKPGPSRRFGTIRTWPWCFLTRDYEIKRFSSALTTLFQRRLTKKEGAADRVTYSPSFSGVALPESCLLKRKVCRMAFCRENTFVLNNFGSEVAVFFWRTWIWESANKKVSVFDSVAFHFASSVSHSFPKPLQ